MVAAPNPLDECPLPARARSLLMRVHALAEDWVERAVRQGLDAFDQHLLRSADNDLDPARRRRFMVAQEGFERSRDACWPRFRQELRRSAAELHLRARGQAYGNRDVVSGGPLSILADAEMEVSLALGEFASYAEMHHTRALHQLGMRLGVIARAPAVAIEHNPFGPKALCDGLDAATAEIDMPAEVRVEMVRVLGRQIFDGLGANLKALNEALIAEGVLPNTVVLAPRRERNRAPRSAPGAVAGPGPGAAAPGSARPATGEDVFAMLRGLLALQSLRGAAQADAVAPRDGAPAFPRGAPGIEDLLATLSERGAAQAQPAAGPGGGGGRAVAPGPGAARPVALTPTMAAAAAQADAARLVDMLLGGAVAAMPAASHGRRLLERLRPAMSRLAVRDPSVFTDRAHPARQLASRLAGPARDLIDSGSEEGLLRRIGRVIEDIDSRPYPGPEVFERALRDLDTQLTELRRLAEETERAHVRAAEEHDWLAHAAGRSTEAMKGLLAGARKASPLLRSLLEQAWTDVVVMAMLVSRNDDLGPDSPAGRRIEVARQLLEADAGAIRQLPASLRPQVVDGLASIGQDPGDIDSLCIRLFDPDRVADDDGVASRTELAMRLRARGRIVDTATAAPPAPVEALDPAAERSQTELATVPIGTWMEFQRPPPEDSLCLKLAWISPLGGKRLFVDARGRRVLEASLAQLARGHASGWLRIRPELGRPPGEEAWDRLIAGLSGRSA